MPDRPTFAIMATGGVGGAFGARLARAGFPVSLVARGDHLAAIRAGGLRLAAPDADFIVRPPVTDNPATIGPVDFVLFAVKLWATEAAARTCRPLIGPETAILSLQNGVDGLELLTRSFGPAHVLGGAAHISARIAAPGVIEQLTEFGRLQFGELDDQQSRRTDALAEAFRAAGIDFEHSTAIRRTVWEKFAFLTGLSALTALTRQPIGRVRAEPRTRVLLAEVVAEVAAVGRACGVPLEDDIVEQKMATFDGLPEAMRASMAHDLAAGRRLELPWLSGAVVRMGAELKLPTPANRFVEAALALDVMGVAKGRPEGSG